MKDGGATQGKETDDTELQAGEPKGETVAGLEVWLRGLQLQKYEAKAEEWCAEMGAVSMEEVTDNWEELAFALALKPLERKRLAKERERAAAEAAAEEAEAARKAEEKCSAAEGAEAARKEAMQTAKMRLEKRARLTRERRDNSMVVEAARKAEERLKAEASLAARKTTQEAKGHRTHGLEGIQGSGETLNRKALKARSCKERRVSGLPLAGRLLLALGLVLGLAGCPQSGEELRGVGTGAVQVLDGVGGRLAWVASVGQERLPDVSFIPILSGSGISRGAGDPGRPAGRGAPDSAD
jgi:hypothetical protein